MTRGPYLYPSWGVLQLKEGHLSLGLLLYLAEYCVMREYLWAEVLPNMLAPLHGSPKANFGALTMSTLLGASCMYLSHTPRYDDLFSCLVCPLD